VLATDGVITAGAVDDVEDVVARTAGEAVDTSAAADQAVVAVAPDQLVAPDAAGQDVSARAPLLLVFAW
jgi:hypothetical protein